jgi:hypothetical protein
MARVRRGADETRFPGSPATLTTRQRRDALVAQFGEDVCDSVEANLHWERFQFLGTLLPTVYVLGKD